MTKLIASVLKKVPVPGIEFSNQQFSGGLEVEVPDEASDEVVRQRLRELYALLSAGVEEEIAAAVESGRRPDARTDARTAPSGSFPEGRGSGYSRGAAERSGWSDDRRAPSGGFRQGGGHSQPRRDDRGEGRGRQGNGFGGQSRGGVATVAQVKAVFGIAKGQGLERRDLMERVEEQYGVRRIEELSIRQASELIENLKTAS